MPARHAVLSTHSVSSRPTHLHSSSQRAYESPQFPVFVFKRLHTLSFSVSRKSCVCHSYENSWVCTNNSHCGTCGSPVNARKRVKFFLFKFLHTLLHASKCQRLCFQALPHSSRKTPGGGGRVVEIFASDQDANPERVRHGGRAEGSLVPSESLPNLDRQFPLPDSSQPPLRHSPPIRSGISFPTATFCPPAG